MLRSLCAGAVAGLLLAAPLHAQSGRPGSFSITPYAGYMKFGNLVDGPLGTSVRGAAGPVYGAEAKLGLTRGLALVGNVAYASTDLEVGVPVVGGLSFGRSSALLYDAALRLSLPLARGRVASIRSCRRAPARCGRRSKSVRSATQATNFAYNVGAGVDVPVGSRLGLQLMAKDYIGKFDAREATAIDVEHGDDAQLDGERGRSAGSVDWRALSPDRCPEDQGSAARHWRSRWRPRSAGTRSTRLVDARLRPARSSKHPGLSSIDPERRGRSPRSPCEPQPVQPQHQRPSGRVARARDRPPPALPRRPQPPVGISPRRLPSSGAPAIHDAAVELAPEIPLKVVVARDRSAVARDVEADHQSSPQ